MELFKYSNLYILYIYIYLLYLIIRVNYSQNLECFSKIIIDYVLIKYYKLCFYVYNE